jgi:hypothetical protein
MSVAGPLPFPTITGVWEWRIGGEGEERKEYQQVELLCFGQTVAPEGGSGKILRVHTSFLWVYENLSA